MDLNNFASSMILAGCNEEAELALKALLASRPDDEQALLNYATLCRISSRLDEALDLVTRYLQGRKERNPQAFVILAMLLEDFGHFEQAATAYAKALKRDPGNQNTSIGYGSACLRLQDFARGWPAWDYGRYLQAWQPPPGLAVWNGSDIRGKRLLVIREGGYGDAIMCARWIPKLLAEGVDVGYFVWDSLHPLLKDMGGWLLAEKSTIDTREWDFCCSLLSLPWKCGMRSIDDIPPPLPIGPPPRTAEGAEVPFAVGICWRAEEAGTVRKMRSMSTADIEPLSACDVKWHSLCPGVPAPGWMSPDQIGIGSWAATANFLASLDLVITVDTAIAHLAGSMGLPTWVIVPMNSEFKWFTPEAFPDSTPWYPTMRVFRQKSPTGWAGVVDEIKRALP